MKRNRVMITTLLLFASAGAAWASEAETSATVGSGFRGVSAASATARYDGDIGFARTETHSGRLTLARSVAVGFDEDGLSLSLSGAVATRAGVALASNFNLSIGSDGHVSQSGGGVRSAGTLYRSASAGGSAGTWRHSPAVSFASGASDSGGFVRAQTHARDYPPPGLAPIHRLIRAYGR